MRYLLLLMLAGCGISKSMDSISSGMGNMQKNIGGMSDSLGATAKAIRSQALSIALGEMMKPENLMYINLSGVIPSSIIPAAKAFGEMATGEEIAGLAHLWIIDLNNGTTDAETEEARNAADLFRLRKLVVLQSIAGMLTTKKTEEVAKYLGNEYDSAIHGFLALRYSFVKTYLLEEGTLKKKKINQKEYQIGKEAVDALSYLEKASFGKLCKLELIGFNSPDLNQTIQIETVAEEYRKKLEAIPKG